MSEVKLVDVIEVDYSILGQADLCLSRHELAIVIEVYSTYSESFEDT
jgi:hypothetical protein